MQFEKKYKECPIWRRNRLTARILLKAQTRRLSPRDRRLARTLLADEGVNSRLIDRGLVAIRGRKHQRHLRWSGTAR